MVTNIVEVTVCVTEHIFLSVFTFVQMSGLMLRLQPSHKVTKSVLRFYSKLLTGGILVECQGLGVLQTRGKTAAAVRKIS